MHPNGTLEWRPLEAEGEVRALIGGKYGASIVADAWVGPAAESATASLRILASDLALAFAEDYEANPKAREVLLELSDDRVIQQQRGVVALCEYDKAPDGEVGFPQRMGPDRVRQINALYEA